MKEVSKLINSDEVISINNQEDNIVISHSTYIVEEFLKQFRSRLGCQDKEQWTNEGVPCKILSPNQNWQKVKSESAYSLFLIPQNLFWMILEKMNRSIT